MSQPPTLDPQGPPPATKDPLAADAGVHPVLRLDDTVHQRVRLGLLSILVEADRAEFTHLRQALELSDGNLNRHLAALVAAGYVTTHKDGSAGRTRTWVRATAAGRQAFGAELAELERLVRAHRQAPGSQAAKLKGRR